MSSSLFVHGRLHAPYFIFVRDAGSCSDADLLGLFGLATYRLMKSAQRRGRCAILAGDGEWTMLADDWFYTLWHMPSTRQAIHQLGHSFDVFACSVGDCDRSFDFIYYQNSRMIRKYVVADPNFRGGIVVENIGEPLPGEAVAFAEADELELVLGVATSLGIRTDYAERDIRVYAPEESGSR